MLNLISPYKFFITDYLIYTSTSGSDVTLAAKINKADDNALDLNREQGNTVIYIDKDF